MQSFNMMGALGKRVRFDSPEAVPNDGDQSQAFPAVEDVQNADEESNDIPPPATLSYFHSAVVSIQLGQCAATLSSPVIQVHESLLCDNSEFFRAKTKAIWEASATGTIDLSDEDPSIFKIFAHFVYTRKVEFKKGGNPSQPFQNLIKSYILGEKLLAPSFQNAIIKALVKYQAEKDKFPGNDAIKLAYEGTPSNSPLRKLLVDFWAKAAYGGWNHQDLVESAGAEFVQDLIEAFLKKRSRLSKEKRKQWSKNPELYYVEDTLSGGAKA
ncbi:hypothetical protein DM02DRAFT_690285 [Periconia macrospinosa]|uniref:BTB domain-containing protein n=1 Tax=Periconia macrospinosa TaxID=97972 RepID=A0A2V1DBI0_9PLEO|nr:hypothetical protein DM02DRAFT_690285 [Periconia macrospinosa]